MFIPHREHTVSVVKTSRLVFLIVISTIIIRSTYIHHEGKTSYVCVERYDLMERESL